MISPVLRRARVQVIGGGEPAGAGHVLHDDGRIAGDVFAEVARDIAGVEIEAAAAGGRDDDPDLLAPVELGDGLLRLRRRRRDASKPSKQTATADRHVRSPRRATIRILSELADRLQTCAAMISLTKLRELDLAR